MQISLWFTSYLNKLLYTTDIQLLSLPVFYYMSSQNTSVLFVCLGNICRSPSAEGVFRHKVEQASFKCKIDSAGTAGYHTGSPPDQRSQAAASARGYNLSKFKCRRVNEKDFEEFDYIIAMDNANVRDLKQKCPEELQHKIHLLLSFTSSEFDEVPDPYYGGGKGFQLVLDLIEQGCDGLIRELSHRNN